MFKPTYLYVKTHNKTGLKYFGKTVQSNPYWYRGSGKRWLNHLDYHGNDVTTEIVGFFTDQDDCKRAALEFSRSNQIVENSQWANLQTEDGMWGGQGHSGSSNSQFGRYWITNGVVNKKIHSTENIPDGWKKGRKMPDGWGDNISSKLKGRTLEDIHGKHIADQLILNRKHNRKK